MILQNLGGGQAHDVPMLTASCTVHRCHWPPARKRTASPLGSRASASPRSPQIEPPRPPADPRSQKPYFSPHNTLSQSRKPLQVHSFPRRLPVVMKGCHGHCGKLCRGSNHMQTSTAYHLRQKQAMWRARVRLAPPRTPRTPRKLPTASLCSRTHLPMPSSSAFLPLSLRKLPMAPRLPAGRALALSLHTPKTMQSPVSTAGRRLCLRITHHPQAKLCPLSSRPTRSPSTAGRPQTQPRSLHICLPATGQRWGDRYRHLQRTLRPPRQRTRAPLVGPAASPTRRYRVVDSCLCTCPVSNPTPLLHQHCEGRSVRIMTCTSVLPLRAILVSAMLQMAALESPYPC